MTRRDLKEGIEAHSRQQRIAATARRMLRSRPRAPARPARSSGTNNMLASFGMIVGLLMIWAMAANM